MVKTDIEKRQPQRIDVEDLPAALRVTVYDRVVLYLDYHDAERLAFLLNGWLACRDQEDG